MREKWRKKRMRRLKRKRKAQRKWSEYQIYSSSTYYSYIKISYPSNKHIIFVTLYREEIIYQLIYFICYHFRTVWLQLINDLIDLLEVFHKPWGVGCFEMVG